MTSQTEEKIKNIKRTFHLFMNGVTSRSMHEKGLDYKINWGVSLGHLRIMAKEYGQDHDLAVGLWRNDVRECKILATMIMPSHEMSPSLAEEWLEQTNSLEIVEMCAFNLFQYLDSAVSLACKWLKSDKLMFRICACHILNRLFIKDLKLDDAEVLNIIKNISTSFACDNISLKHAAVNCLRRLSLQNEIYAKYVEDAVKQLNLDIFQ